MRIFGGILPYIGFRTIEVDEDLRRELDLPAEMKTANQFCVEWLNLGIGVISIPPRS